MEIDRRPRKAPKLGMYLASFPKRIHNFVIFVFLQHFRALAEENKLDNALKGQDSVQGESDTLVL